MIDVRRAVATDPARACVMQCGRPASGHRVDHRDLCAHCFIVVVEIIAHEFKRTVRELQDAER
jgi:hypothetical protein